MRFWITSIITSIVLTFYVETINAQTPSTDPFQVPEVLPNSPEAAALGIYGSIPTNQYSGNPKISIPIHTVKAGNLELPISLSYNATGIKVDQEATLIGLGWNLIAGGNIQYIPVGSDERVNSILPYSPRNLETWADWEEAIDFVDDGKGIFTGDALSYFDLVYATGRANHLSMDVIGSGSFYGDGEQDIYSVNCMGLSFKFMLHPDTHVPIFVGERNKCEIELTAEGFKIIGENGTIYSFEDVEKAHDHRFSEENAWYLSRLEDLQGNWIELDYHKFGDIRVLPTINDQLITNDEGLRGIRSKIERTVIGDYSRIDNIYLTQILTANEQIDFQLSTDRLDVSGDGAAKLTDIIITDLINGETRLHYQFEYDYFDALSNTIGGNYLYDRGYLEHGGFSNDNLTKRLKLNSLSLVNPVNITEFSAKYLFEYNEDYLLPWKTSFAKDFWGYYNGIENDCANLIAEAEHSFLPNAYIQAFADIDYRNIPEIMLLITRNGANRGMSSTYATTASLKSITYPTGGKTEFEFEPHVFDNRKYLSAEDFDLIDLGSRKLSVNDWNNTECSKTEDSFTLFTKTRVTVGGYIDRTNLPLGTDLSTAYIRIEGDEPGNSHLVFEFKYQTHSPNDFQEWDIPPIELDSGRYLFTCNLPDVIDPLSCRTDAPAVRGTVDFDLFDPRGIPAAQSIGGGLRVAQMINKDINGEVLSTKKFTYEGGYHLTPLSNYFIESHINAEVVGGTPSCPYIDPYGVTSHKLSGNNYLPLAQFEVGTNVGYNKVIIEKLDNSGQSNGQEIFEFDNNTPTGAFHSYFYINPTNGNLKSLEIKDASGNTVQKEINHYSEAYVNQDFINIIIKDIYIGPQIFICSNPGMWTQTYGLDRYVLLTYRVSSFFNQLDYKETTEFYPDGNSLYKRTDYTYNEDNYSVSEMIESLSTGETQTSYYLYPPDYPNATEQFIVDMNKANIINKPIEQYTIKDNKVNKGSLITYKAGNLVGKKDKQYILQSNVPLAIGAPNFLVSNNDGGFKVNSYYNSNPNDPTPSVPDPEIIYDNYDALGNLLQYHSLFGPLTSYIWGYNYTLPIAKIENANFSQVLTALGRPADDNLSYLQGYSESQIIAEIQKIRTYFLSAKVSVYTYTYKRLVGIRKIIDPNGLVTTYSYDDFGRLENIKNNDGDILQEYEYHYQGEE